MTKRPSFQFYPGDWRRDAELQSCSVTARGLWHEAMCIMHECEPYGELRVNGKPMSTGQLARLVGMSLSECKRALDELEAAGVPSRTEDGALYSRRMVRDEAIRMGRAAFGPLGAEHGVKGAEHGAKGGRPRNATGVKKPPLQPGPSSSSSSSEVEEDPSLRSGGAREGEPTLFKSEVPEIPAFLDRRVKAATALPDWMPLETWAAFVQSRKKITPHASKLLISALTKFREAGDDPKTVLEQSIMNGWRGLFPLKRMNGNGHGQRRESPHEQTERVARELIAEIDASDDARDHNRDREAGNPLPRLLAYDPGIAPGMDRDAMPGSGAQVPRRAAVRG